MKIEKGRSCLAENGCIAAHSLHKGDVAEVC